MNNREFLSLGNYQVNEIKDKSQKLAKHFFNQDTMRFFKSRISELTWKIEKSIYFITSEKNRYEDPRKFTIRESTELGDIKTIGEFQQYFTLSQARKGIKEILELQND